LTGSSGDSIAAVGHQPSAVAEMRGLSPQDTLHPTAHTTRGGGLGEGPRP
jgi:hypothetical protein